MDDRIGPLVFEAHCGYNAGKAGSEHNSDLNCTATPVVRHLLFNTKDESGLYASGLACEIHANVPDRDLILLEHEIGTHCLDLSSRWNLINNSCEITLI